jgi:hypothetical protein
VGIKNKMENVAKKQAKGKDKSFCPSLAWKKGNKFAKIQVKEKGKGQGSGVVCVFACAQPNV